MKVVLFCGGLGTRLRDYSESVPKPMVPLGNRPILWHIMKYYAHFGHRDFILCLGYKADVIKRYFLNYEEFLSNDFIMSGGGKKIEMLATDIDEWRITFVDTGLNANIGERLLKVRPFVEDDDIFLANYTDGLADVPLDRMVSRFKRSGKVAAFLSVQPTASFHLVHATRRGSVQSIRHIRDSKLRINGGFFAFRQQLFDYITPGDELVEQPFQRLIAAGKLAAHQHDGFWASMDTFKEREQLNDMHTQGRAPWELWDRST